MRNHEIIEDDSLDPFTIKLNDKYELIPSDQRLGLYFIFSSLEELTKSCRTLDIIRHHLFKFYYTFESFCMDNSHCCSTRERIDIIELPFLDEPEYLSKILSTLIDTTFVREEQLDHYQCQYCLGKEPGKGRTCISFHTFSRVLLVRLNKRGGNNNHDVEFSRYLKLQGDKEVVVHYQLLGTLVYSYNEKFISYFLHSDKKWYKDDGEKIIEVTAYDACHQPKAYFSFIKRLMLIFSKLHSSMKLRI